MWRPLGAFAMRSRRLSWRPLCVALRGQGALVAYESAIKGYVLDDLLAQRMALAYPHPPIEGAHEVRVRSVLAICFLLFMLPLLAYCARLACILCVALRGHG